MPDRYSQLDEGSVFGLLENAMFDGGKDEGAAFPRTDAEDLSRGARFIPDPVTVARRAGQRVKFVTNCGPNCWYWELFDGSRIYHYDPDVYDEIGRHNHGIQWSREQGLAGSCPRCGNPHTRGNALDANGVDQH